jgi:hypothetical protein
MPLDKNNQLDIIDNNIIIFLNKIYLDKKLRGWATTNAIAENAFEKKTLSWLTTHKHLIKLFRLGFVLIKNPKENIKHWKLNK